MQFEEFDKKVKEAADQHHPSYDETAWAKMENLLERHLPLNDGRNRRTIVFLLLFLFLGGGAWLIAERPWQQEDSTKLANQQPGVSVSPSSPNNLKEKASNEIEGVTNPVASSPGEVSQPIAQQPSETRLSSPERGIASDPVGQSNPGNNKNRITKKKPSRDEDVVDIDVAAGKSSKTGQPSAVDGGPAEIILPVTSNDKAGKQPAEIKDDSKADQPTTDKVQDNASDSKKTEATKAPEAEKAKSNKSSQKKGNTFFVSFSAGPDYSFVSTDYPGKVEVLGGAGLGYTFNDRWTVRTGFYSTQKVYTAGKDDYKPSGGVNANFEKVNANCRVYEIPLNLSYNFGKSDKNVWFASTGLSSYIMKKEEYVYWYNYNGSLYPWSKTINNENKHYFSVLSLSGGYQRKISRTFTVAAEPYLKIPLAGVGYGNVKLNSAGILFSVNVNLIKPAEKK